MQTTSHADLLVELIDFATCWHGDQKTPDGKPYITHLMGVTLLAQEAALADGYSEDEIRIILVIAMLHDLFEDTVATPEVVKPFLLRFGLPVDEVIAAIQALTKDSSLSKPERMPASIRAILALPHRVGLVKLADRCWNMHRAPEGWSTGKRSQYQAEAWMLWSMLKHRSPFLEEKLKSRIESYAA